MPPTNRASSSTSFHSTYCHPRGETTSRKQVKLAPVTKSRVVSSGTKKSKGKAGDVTARCTRSQTAIRLKENKQLQVKSEVSNEKGLSCTYTRQLDDVNIHDQGSFSGIHFSQECGLRKEVEIKKSSYKTFNGSRKGKHSSRNKKGRQKERIVNAVQREESPERGTLLSQTDHLNGKDLCTGEVSATPQAIADETDSQATTPNRHEAIKAKIGLLRRRMLQEQASVARLKDKLARNKDTARASLSCRRIRIQKELQKLKERIQSEDQKRLKIEEARIQKQLEASQRKVDSDRVSMKIELAKEWRDRFQQRKQEVRRAKRALKEQIWNHEVEKKALLKQLQKDWTAQLNKVQAMKDRIETQMVKDGRHWDGGNWTSTGGKHKYSLRRAPREKTHIYCRAWKMGGKKDPKTPIHVESSPRNGGTVYKETKQKTLMELYQCLDNELRCSICSELFISAVVLNCSHTFCSYCITQWKRRTDRCPICRTNIASRNPIVKLDSFITKFARRVGGEAEKKRSEMIKDRQDQEKKLQQEGRSWGNLANHSLDDLDSDDDDDFNDSLYSYDSDVDEFLEILQHRVGGSTFRSFFDFGIGDDMDEDFFDSDDDEDFLLSSDDDLGLEDDFAEEERRELEGELWAA